MKLTPLLMTAFVATLLSACGDEDKQAGISTPNMGLGTPKPCTFLVASREVTEQWYQTKGRDYFCKDKEFFFKNFPNVTNRLTIDTGKDSPYPEVYHVNSVYIDESSEYKEYLLKGGFDTITVNKGGIELRLVGSEGKVKKLILNTTDSSIDLNYAKKLQPKSQKYIPNQAVPQWECVVTDNVKNTKVLAPEYTTGYNPCKRLEELNQGNTYLYYSFDTKPL